MIDILLASYNGAEFIGEQIESILAQTYSDWRLFINDDCSTDKTEEIVKQYSDKYSDKIFFSVSEKPSRSAKANFLSMLSLSSAEYIMFSDQDDVWLPNKLALTLEEMNRLEAGNRGLPLLVHTDLCVADKHLNVISPSMWRSQKLNPDRMKKNQLIVQNVITGCTVMINRRLLDFCRIEAENIIMHDWWFALIACYFGKIGYVDKATILYRQHGNNSVGAKNVTSIKYLVKRGSDTKGAKRVLADTYMQAGAFERLYGDVLSVEDKEILGRFCNITKSNKLGRILTLFKGHYWKNTFARKVGQIIFL